MHALGHILTGTMHSRILGKARKRGLTYGIYSDVSRGMRSTSWDFEGQANFDTAEPLFDLIVRELENVLNGNISQEELDSMKSYALGSFQMSGQTVASTGGFYAGRYYWDGKIRDHAKQAEFINQVSLEKILQLAQEFISQGIFVLGAVSGGDRHQVEILSAKIENLLQNNR